MPWRLGGVMSRRGYRPAGMPRECGEPVTATARQMDTTSEACREDAMNASHTRTRSRGAGALLGAVAVLVAGCTAAGGGSGPRAGQAGAAPGAVTASPSGHSFAHRTG